jgi:hypothetical protein
MRECEHTRILGALVEHPQGNLEEIQQETLRSTQEEPVGRPYIQHQALYGSRVMLRDTTLRHVT